MSTLYITASAVIDAQPDEVYAVLADYRTGHPAILPKGYFSDLQVESGGYGEGTVIRFRLKLFGVENTARQVVSEPAPGQVLVEANTDRPLKTTFTVTPHDNGRQAEVNITTEYEAKGIQGLIERIVLPPVLRGIYVQELQQLAEYLKSKHAIAA